MTNKSPAVGGSSPREGTRGVPDLVLERVALGEVDGAAWGIAADDVRVAALRDDSAATLARMPRAAVAARVHAALAPDRPRSPSMRSWFALATPAALATAVVLVVVARAPGDEPRTDAAHDAKDVVSDGIDDVTVVKGITPALALYAVRETGTAPLAGPARAGDRVQVATLPAGRAHGVVLSLDGRGGVTLHFPEDAAGSTALAGRASLPHSFELDDAPAFERFVFVTSAAPIDVAQVLAAARETARGPAARTDALALLPGLEQWSRVVDKVSR